MTREEGKSEVEEDDVGKEKTEMYGEDDEL